ncbi:MAG: 2-oxoacid:acceptor oxidoreductase family protein, partial [Asticcacaulis sp.]
NDVVAMTGGQSVDGQLTPVMVAQQVRAEGVERIALVSPDPEKWEGDMPSGTTYAHRDDLEAVQKDLRDYKGVSVLIYDQACATELRRRRKRGTAPKPAARLFINPAVCEGCGDCQAKSNCVAINPLETELGRKREIDQSACNIDTSCVKGFCPSFVAVEGAALKKAAAPAIDAYIADLPDITPPLPGERAYNILLAGIGGLGVTSLSAMLGMAAHIDGHEVSVADQTGLAQRGGGVDAHVRIVGRGERLPSPRIAAGEADVVLAADMVQATGKTALPLLSADRAVSFVNSALTSTAAFTLNRDLSFDRQGLMGRLRKASKRLEARDAGGVARRFLGDAVYGHMILLGAAWQAGTVPLSRFAIEEAIELNGAEKANNHKAFALGRALYLGRVEAPEAKPDVFDAEAFVARRIADLTAYQDAGYAAQYKALIDEVRASGSATLLEAVARHAFRLMAYKDEYEVARLYADPAFRQRLMAQFEDAGERNPKSGNRFSGSIARQYKLSVYLAPPLLARRDPATGEPRKMKFGPWAFRLFGVLKGFRGLRGTLFDPFGHTQERHMERRLRNDYVALIRRLLPLIDAHNIDLAVAIARLPEDVRGFGHVKAASVETYEARKAALIRDFEAARPEQPAQTKKEMLHV